MFHNTNTLDSMSIITELPIPGAAIFTKTHLLILLSFMMLELYDEAKWVAIFQSVFRLRHHSAKINVFSFVQEFGINKIYESTFTLLSRHQKRFMRLINFILSMNEAKANQVFEEGQILQGEVGYHVINLGHGYDRQGRVNSMRMSDTPCQMIQVRSSRVCTQVPETFSPTESHLI